MAIRLTIAQREMSDGNDFLPAGCMKCESASVFVTLVVIMPTSAELSANAMLAYR